MENLCMVYRIFSLLTFIYAVCGQSDGAGTCNQALGMESGAIANGRITASSYYNERRSPRYARLHQRDGDGGWTVGPDSGSDARLTIDLGMQARVIAVATQGRYNSNEFVKEYNLAYSQDGTSWQFVLAGDTEKTFSGNINSDDVVKRMLPSPVEARYIRFMPLTYNGKISMRVELYGCLIGGYSATFDGTNYIKWDLTRPKDTLNFDEELFEFYFLTSEPNGIILSGYGTQGDYIVLALMQGKLHLGLNLGTNSLYSDGKASLTVGSLLDDNMWHHVRYVRDSHHIRVFLDGTKVRGEAEGDFSDLNLDKELTLGGASERAKVLYQMTDNFQGCIQNVLLSESTDVSLLGIALDFIKEVVVGSRSSFSMIGALQQGCSSTATSSITFPTIDSYLKWNVPTSGSSFTVHVRFRTFDADSLILYNAQNNGGIVLGLRASVFVVAINDGASNQFVDIPAGFGLNDGLWHRVRVEVANNRVQITVDGVVQESSRSTSFVSPSRDFFIGGSTLPSTETAYLSGFRGCVSELSLQGTMVDFSVLESSPLPSGIQNNMAQVDTCRLQDWCSPTPCEHGGKCTSDWDTFVCDCTDTGYTGAVCHTTNYEHNCEHIGVNGGYTVDVDGSGPLPPFTITCNIDATTLYHWTEITHNAETLMAVPSEYTSAGSYEKRIEYSATLDQMDELIESSENCEQFISYQCTRSKLFNSPSGPPYGWWVSRHDQMMLNWGGAAAGTGRCACGVGMTCAPDNSKYCNCDSEGDNLVDEGLLTEKEYLPVTQLRFGLSGTNPSADFQLGRLRCRGDKYLANTVSFVKREAHLMSEVETTQEGALDISFDFKTTFDPSTTEPASAAVFFAAEAENEGLIEVKLINDRTVQLQFNYGADLTTISSTVSSPLNDDQWHSIKANFDRKEVWLQVDSTGQEKATLTRPELRLEMDGPLFIGASTLQVDGYIGCMRKMMVNGEMVDLMRLAEESKDVLEGCIGQCSTQPCLNGGVCMEKYDSVACDCVETAFMGMYCSREVGVDLSAGSMVTYSLPVSLQQQSQMDNVSLAFKTDQTSGRIFRVENGANFMQVAMAEGGNVMFEAQLGGGNPVSITQNRNFADDKNHFVKILRNGMELSFQIDDYLPMKEMLVSTTFTPATIYVGSVDNSFMGCISRVQFNTIFPLKDYTSAPRPTGLTESGVIRESHCGIHEARPMLLPSEDYPPTEEPMTTVTVPSARPVRTDLAAGDKAAIAIVVILLLLALFLLLFLIGRYTSRHKGMYNTNEDKGAKNAMNADDAIALQGSKRPQEYYM